MPNVKTWMISLDENILFEEITMPGSNNNEIHTHDINQRPNYAPSQIDDIATQFDNGSRWFDAELKMTTLVTPDPNKFKSKSKISNFINQNSYFAIPFETEQLSGNISGRPDVQNQLLALMNRVQQNTSEFVVLRIFNLELNTHSLISNILMQNFGTLLFVNTGDALMKTPYKDLRGKIVVLFDTYQQCELKSYYSKTETEIHPHVSFNRYAPNADTSPSCVNTYATALSNPTRSIQHVLEKTLIQKTGNHSSNPNCMQNPSHLFMVYMTDGAISHMPRPAAVHHAGVGQLLREDTLLDAKHPIRSKLMPNVIMYDHVDEVTSHEIITLNHPDCIKILFSPFGSFTLHSDDEAITMDGGKDGDYDNLTILEQNQVEDRVNKREQIFEQVTLRQEPIYDDPTPAPADDSFIKVFHVDPNGAFPARQIRFPTDMNI